MECSSTMVFNNYDIKVGVFSDKGVRKENEDSFLISKDITSPTFMVADGAGGYSFGKEASKTCVKAFISEIEHLKNTDTEYFKKLLEKKYNQINEHLFNKLKTNNTRMMSTITQATIMEKKLIVSNIGDTILYRLRDNEISILSEIHSLAWEEYKSNEITYEEYLNHPKKNVITRAVGGREEIVPFIYEYDINIDDIFIICTDGIYNHIREDEIKEYLINGNFTDEDLSRICNDIGTEVLSRKSSDNVTILIFQILAI